jgi:glycosyltransferase involved in cell wall biosynthesis
MKKISIFTLTMGRWFYLQNLINSIEYDEGIEHFIIFQGVSPTEELTQLMLDKKIKPIFLAKNIGIAMAMNLIYKKLSGDIIIKFDEDAKIVSKDFFKHVREIHSMSPKLVFSPYPVGLINNPGGVLSKNHQVGYSRNTDTYYTMRVVNHIGGFARISPREFTIDWVFNDDLIEGVSGNEDGQHSTKCVQENIPMAYLENCLIVEHQESTLGQHKRYGEEYFKGRF